MNAKIITQRIISSNIYISEHLPDNFELQMGCQAKIKNSRYDDNTVLLHIHLTIGTADEQMKMEFLSDIVFALDQLPNIHNDYNRIAEQLLIPMAQKSLLDSMDEMLVIMGYRKMNLTRNSL